MLPVEPNMQILFFMLLCIFVFKMKVTKRIGLKVGAKVRRIYEMTK